MAVKYLGIELDKFLNFKIHISISKNKGSVFSGVFCRLKIFTYIRCSTIILLYLSKKLLSESKFFIHG